MGRKLSRLEVIRHKSDYDDFYIAGKEESVEQTEIAAEFLGLVREYVRKYEEDPQE